MTTTRKYKSVGVGLTHEQLAWLDSKVKDEREKTGLPVTRSNYIQRMIEAEKKRVNSSAPQGGTLAHNAVGQIVTGNTAKSRGRGPRPGRRKGL